MTYSPGDYCAQHSEPAWKDKANFICLARLDDATPKWEQLWVHREEGELYLVCCVPFFIYNIALGDLVELDGSNIVERVAKSGGNATLRVWFDETGRAERERVIEDLSSKPCVLEWSSENLLALSCAEGDARGLVEYLQAEEDRKVLTYETGRTNCDGYGH